MQTEFSGRADVHGGTFAHSFHAAEDFDGVGGVVSVGGFAVLGLRVVCRVVFRVEEFGLQFFRGHSAPWRMPDSDAWLEGRFRDCSGELNLLNFLLVSCHQSLRYFNTKGAYFKGWNRSDKRRFLLLLGDRKSTRLNSSHLGISYAV